MKMTAQAMAQTIDHTLLRPDATPAMVAQLCAEAQEHQFKAVCVNGCHVGQAGLALKGSGISVCAVIGFPLGANAGPAKAQEAMLAAADGADEIDMVLNIGRLKAQEDANVLRDVRNVRNAIGDRICLKVIIETCLLSESEKVRACELSRDAGADFVKTSTGFAGGGATTADVALMRKTVGDAMGVKASGGIKDWETATAMLSAGANRLGTSSGVAILGSAPA
ncbi:MAG: deoxyribose-phosphate aldolase [Desulfosarcinaceae bacterium]|nr:deoxyribose-phosphate aldolase [Desulfosarcinaceae bacterium]